MILNQMPIDFDSLRMTDRQIDCNRTPSALRERFAAPNNELLNRFGFGVYTGTRGFAVLHSSGSQDFGQHSYNNPSPWPDRVIFWSNILPYLPFLSYN